MAEEKNGIIKKAKKEMNYLTGDEEVRRLAELREKWDEEYEASMRYAREKGEKAGMEVGLREGKEKERKKIVQNLLKKGLSMNDIVELTELSKEEIEELLPPNN